MFRLLVNPRRIFYTVLAIFVMTNPALAMSGQFDVLQSGARGDGNGDDTAAFQKALDAAGNHGGGIVFVPAGKYMIKTHLVIPRGVTLQGVSRAPRNGIPYDEGSTLLAVEGKGSLDGTPFIAMNTSATLEGISVFYPEQIIANPPHPYPWTIQSIPEADNCSVINVTLVNPYQAVDFGTYMTGRHFVSGLYAYPLFKGLYINQCYDVGRVENVHFWPFWDLNPKSPLWVFTRENATAFIIGRTDGEMVSNCFSIFYKVGMHFIAGPIADGKGGTRNYSPGSGVYTNCYMDVTPCAIKVDSVMANAGVSFVNGMFMSGIEVGPENRGQVKFTGCGFWAVSGLKSHAKIEGSGTVFFESCHFSNWDQASSGEPCLDINSKQAIVTGCEFSASREKMKQIRLGTSVQAAVISSNLMPGGVGMENNAPGRADVQIGLNAAGHDAGFLRKWLLLGMFPNPEASAGAAGPSRLGLDTDHLTTLGGEVEAVVTPETVVAVDGASVRARELEADSRGAIQLKEAYPEGKGVAYAFHHIDSPTDQTARFELGANDCSKIWVNGELVHRFWSEEGGDAKPGTYSFTAPLKKGLNRVLVKVEDAGGRRWEFTLQAFDEKGDELE